MMPTEQIQQQQEDSVKKGKILFVVLFITISFFLNKVLGPLHPILSNSLILGLIYAAISFWGFIWILSFKVNARIILLVLPQIVLIIFSQIIFLDMFFEQAFGRLYETVLMIGLLAIFFVITHIIFLTGNVFAVSTFKKIPLEAVAKTIIYIVSALSVFFAAYGFLSLQIPIIFSAVLLLFFCFFSVFFLLSNFHLEISTVFNYTNLIFWNIFLVVIGALLFSSRVEFVALLTTVVFYFSVGLFISKKEQINNIKILEYVIILILISVFAFYFSFF